MKVAVLGAGVVGMTSAWYLQKAGHEVVVIDRQPGPALETSFANAGEISPGYASPWAAPGVPLKAVGWLFRRHAPLKLRLRVDAHLLGWLLALIGNCTTDRYALNKRRMVRLAEYSRAQLADLRAETGISYDERMRGTLQVFRSAKQLDRAAADVAVLRDLGLEYELLDLQQCIEAEPGLASRRAGLTGGLRLPGDETGDCFLFTSRLAELCAARGVAFCYNTSIIELEQEAGRIVGARTNRGRITADAWCVAAGSFSRSVVRSLGIDVPVYPVKGYSLTADITNAAKAPVSTLLDETYKIAITRLGDRVRVGGMAELAGVNLSLPPSRRETLNLSVNDLFPQACDLANARFWTGLRPMTPDGTPLISRTRYENLFLNTGHGTLGWTMACGSGRLLTDIVDNRRTSLPTDDYSIDRYA